MSFIEKSDSNQSYIYSIKLLLYEKNQFNIVIVIILFGNVTNLNSNYIYIYGSVVPLMLTTERFHIRSLN